MADLIHPKNGCCSGGDCSNSPEVHSRPQPLFVDIPSDEVCCGSAPGPQSSPYEKPGYELLPFVDKFIDTPVGPVPVVKTQLERTDFMGAIIARLGIGRDQYKIASGLYGVGNPGQDSPVLVTANYKLSFDVLRREMTSLDAWILVIDTRGIKGKQGGSCSEVKCC